MTRTPSSGFVSIDNVARRVAVDQQHVGPGARGQLTQMTLFAAAAAPR